MRINLSRGVGRLKIIGGSQNDNWNIILANQTVGALSLSNVDEEALARHCAATVSGLFAIGPKDVMEGMIAVQTHCRP